MVPVNLHYIFEKPYRQVMNIGQTWRILRLRLISPAPNVASASKPPGPSLTLQESKKTIRAQKTVTPFISNWLLRTLALFYQRPFQMLQNKMAEFYADIEWRFSLIYLRLLSLRDTCSWSFLNSSLSNLSFAILTMCGPLIDKLIVAWCECVCFTLSWDMRIEPKEML